MHLDQRPLGQVLLDPVAVDRAAIARRLGLPPALIDHIQLNSSRLDLEAVSKIIVVRVQQPAAETRAVGRHHR